MRPQPRFPPWAALPLGLLAGALVAISAPAAAARPPEVVHDCLIGAVRSGDARSALVLLRELQVEHPAFHAANGHDYLTGVMAEQAGEDEAAVRALRRVIEQPGPLVDRATLRLATLLRHRRPAEALRLVAGFATRHPASAVISSARRLEVVLRAETGDAAGAERVLRSLPRMLRREVAGELLERERARGQDAAARTRARALLGERIDDAAAYRAASCLLGFGSSGLPTAERWRLAQALVRNREFAAAAGELLHVAGSAKDAALRLEARYELGRAALRAGDDGAAAAAFASVAAAGGRWGVAARYQLGRLYLACGDREQAELEFRRLAAETEPQSDTGASALLKLVRIYIERGDGHDLDEARRIGREIAERLGPGSRQAAEAATKIAGGALQAGDARGALSDLEQVRPDRLEDRRSVAYWRGVALAASGREAEAATELGSMVQGFDLLSTLARERLKSLPSALHTAAVAGLEQSEQALGEGRHQAAVRLALAGLDAGLPGDQERRALAVLDAAYRQLTGYRDLFDLVVPAPRPPHVAAAGRELGHAAAVQELRFLGLDAEAAEELRAAYPGKRPLAVVFQVAELARRGGDARTAVSWAAMLLDRVPRDFHPAVMPPRVLRLLYPDAYAPIVEQAALLRGVDPDLLLAVMREESRFDPRALSPAGARGLMQFIPETARRVGDWIGREGLDPESVHEPALAISLGAAYLSRLLVIFEGNVGAAVAAYNAGEEAAYTWVGRTRQGVLDELLREIEYRETRTYVDRVLTTLAGYRSRRERESIE